MPASITVTVSDTLARKVGKYAKRVAVDFDNQSILVNKSTRTIPTVSDIELMIGKFLGRGGFNTVREVKIKSRPNGFYAIKHLKSEVLEKESDFLTGATDLVGEARILNSLSHPNIISLHAVSDVPIQESYLDGGHYFLILDRLECTVEDKLVQWRALRKAGEMDPLGVMTRLKTVALPVAKALGYLHSKSVIFRDLKPANIGFDRDGNVKLFDFGLARTLDKSGRRMTGSTGSRRYMAPEVALCEEYDLSADVFSFAVFLWELTSLDKPFERMNRADHMEQVVYGHFRPEITSSNGSSRVQRLIRKGWKVSQRQRPDFNEITKVLDNETRQQKQSSSLMALLRMKNRVTLPILERARAA